jgi:hypothetical protein
MVILFIYHDNLNLQQAIDKMLFLIHEHYEICVAAEARLPRTNDAQLNADIHTYVVGCQDLAVGTAYWSYNCERYFKFSQMNERREVLLIMNNERMFEIGNNRDIKVDSEEAMVFSTAGI